ncbi:IS1380 family transposase [Rhodococcus sp. NPDC056960]|uniref:IS1380 family transposase n=1 Tax=Rhodococcus sp. NPDC056960 TaxID=3345982 RepID=UPI003633D800
MKSSHTFRVDSAVFDERNLVSSAGLVPVLELAEQAGLSELIDVHVDIDSARVKSGAANPVGKLTSIIAGMCTGADVIDDMNLLRAGGMPALFDKVYAPSTLGIFLREFTFGHSLQLGAVLRRHLIALAARTPLLPGIEDRAFLDIDSLLRPVYGHAKEGASYGHAKVSGRTVLRKGLNPLVTTLSTAQAAPVVTEMRLRGGKTGSGRGAASQLRSAITTARACGATGKIMVRGDSAFGNKSVIGAAIAAGIEFSVGMNRNPRITRAIDGIDEQDWVPVHYPGAVTDPESGKLISDAEVAEVEYTAFSGRHQVTARLIVRRVKDANYPDALFPVWRYHPFFTNSDLPTVDADLTHRKHAIVETVFADLIDGPLAHIPSGRFPANCAWVTCAAIAHNLLRAAGTLAGGNHAVARGATLRRDLVNVPARFARPAGKPVLHLPAHWPWQKQWNTLWCWVIGSGIAPPQLA